MPKINEDIKNERKTLILEHAFKVFSEKGYSDASMNDIVESSGVSKGGIYTYFKSKEEIFIAIAEERFNDRKKLVDSFKVNMTCAQKITRYIEWIIDWIIDIRNLSQLKFTFEFWSVTSRSENMKNAAADRYEKISRDLNRILEEGVSKGEFKSGINIDSVTYIILASTDGIGFFNGIMGIKANENIKISLANIILNYICKGDNND